MVPFKLSEADIWPGCHEIRLEGELDRALCGRLRAALAGATFRHEHVLIDLTACDFIDASALALLVRSHERLRYRGRQLTLVGAHGQVWRLLSVTGLIESELSLAAPARIPRGRRVAATPVSRQGTTVSERHVEAQV